MSRKIRSYLVVACASLAVILAVAALPGPGRVHAQQGQQPPLNVPVTNDILRSVPVFGTDNPAFTPFQASVNVSAQNGISDTGGTIAVVPAGMRLVYRVRLPAGHQSKRRVAGV